MKSSTRARAVILLAIPFAAGAGSLSAQAPTDTVPPDSVVAVPGLTVQVARPVTTAGGASAIEARLSELRLPPAPTLDLALRRIPLITVRTNSRGEAMLSLRGSEERQVAVLVDGVPLSLGWDHRADLAVVPLTGAQQITLVRGLSSVLHGPNVLGGVVEVGVARGPWAETQPRQLTASAGVDHLGGRSVGVVAASPFEGAGGEWLVRAGAGHRGRSGMALPGGLPAAAGGFELTGGEDRLLNTDYSQTDGFAAVRFRGDGGAWGSLSASGYRAERGVAPELHVAEPRFWRYPDSRRVLAAVSGGTGQRATRWGVGDLEASLGVDAGSSEIQSFASADYESVVERELADDRTLSLRLLGDHTLGDRADLKAAFTWAEVLREESILEPALHHRVWQREDARYRQRLWSMGGETTLRLGDVAGLSATRLSAGVAVDGADTPETGGRPALGWLWDWGGRIGATGLAAGGDVLLHAGLSRRARFPSLRELYSAALGRFVPNPDLGPEVLVAGEAGVTTRMAGLELQLVAFHHRLDGAIGREAAGDGRFRRVNADAMRSTGVEVLTGWRLGPASMAGELTLQRVRLVGPDGEQREPEYHPGVVAGLDLRSPLAWGVDAAAGVELTGRQFCVHPDLREDVPLEASTRVDAELGRDFDIAAPGGWAPATLRVTAAVENVTDAAIYDQCGLPQPGRTFRVAVRLH